MKSKITAAKPTTSRTMYVVAELGLDDILGGSSGGEFVLF
jgi:hypothetical protein